MKYLNIALMGIALAGPAAAQHTNHAHGPQAEATEPGQSAFAAIAEIVALLRDDPMTDWALVDIDALRNHLVDMDRVTTGAVVTTSVTEQTVSFDVTGGELTRPAIRRMMAAHAPMLAAETGWFVTIIEHDEATEMQIVSEQPMLVEALGFHGVMTIGAHHQDHHLQIALGRDPHH